MIISAY